jgi:hypothetical protein
LCGCDFCIAYNTGAAFVLITDRRRIKKPPAQGRRVMTLIGNILLQRLAVQGDIEADALVVGRGP